LGRWEDIHVDSNAEIERLYAPEPLAIDVLIASENQACLSDAIDDLPEKYRVPLVLAYFVHLSYPEIATLLGTNRNHVGILLLRAKQQVRRCLQQTTEQKTLHGGVE
jgi:RNA polymerase sigma factor (sigma-70 family)